MIRIPPLYQPQPQPHSLPISISAPAPSSAFSTPRQVTYHVASSTYQLVTFSMSCIWTQAVMLTLLLSIGLHHVAEHMREQGICVGWFAFLFALTGVLPWIEWWILKMLSDGWLVNKEKRQQQNHTFTHHISLLSYYNMFETAAQAIIHVHVGYRLGRINMVLYPQDALSLYAWARVILQAWTMLFVADVANYFFHRFAHINRWLYHNMHALHHQHREPEHSVFSLFYVHPIEMFMSNVCFLSGTFMFPTVDLFTILLFGFISSIYVGAGHSGLLLPPFLDWLLDTSFHELHHAKNYCNFSEHFTLMDRFMGTYLELSDKEKQMRRDAQSQSQSQSQSQKQLNIEQSKQE